MTTPFPEWLAPMAAPLTQERFTAKAIADLPVDNVILDGEMTWDRSTRYDIFDILSLPRRCWSICGRGSMRWIPKSPVTKAKGLPRVRAHWVRPKVVVQVAFTEWTVHGKLRHSRLLAIREDKAARDVKEP